MALTAEQAKRLYLVVRASQCQGFLIPSGPALAAIFYPGREIGLSQVRAANAIVDRLRKLGCVRLQGGRRCIDASRLVTEGGSALYLLKFREMCLTNRELAVDGEKFHNKLLRDFRNVFSPELLAELKSHAIKSGYLVSVETKPGALRIGRNLSEHLPYLEMLARDRKVSPARERRD